MRLFQWFGFGPGVFMACISCSQGDGLAGENSQTSGGGSGSAQNEGGRDGTGGADGATLCGNGVLDDGERCDDRDTTPGDGCSATCRVETGWECDQGEPTGCDELCGDGRRVGAEAKAAGCDDDNTQLADGCDESCRVEAEWDCTGEPSVCERADGGSQSTGGAGPTLECTLSTDCDDDDVCTDDTCIAGVCEHQDNTLECDDGIDCTQGDYCVAGVCSGTAVDGLCDDGNVCTDEVCIARQGCVFADNSASCDDGLYCTGTESCSGGVCVSSGDPCDGEDGDADCSETCDEEGASCTGNDANESLCAGGGVCTRGTCQSSCNGLTTQCQGESCCTSNAVPEQKFTLGLDVMDSTSEATVAAFRLDKYEVTLGRLERLVAGYDAWRAEGNPVAGAGAHPLILGSGWQAEWVLPADAAELVSSLQCSAAQTWGAANKALPANCVSWTLANAFCVWDGQRLPTEAEWESAAVGGDAGRPYPWGVEEPNASLAVYDCLGDGSAAGACAFADILNVGSKSSGRGRWEHEDLAGSMWEWTLDYYSETYPETCDNCANLAPPDVHVVRGGDWGGSALNLGAALHTNYFSSDGRNSGLRCARTP